MYPQLDIRRYDPQMSPDLATLVMGRFVFMDLPHEARVQRLYALIEMYRAVRRIGELEHTSDWDWRIEIMYAPNPDGSGTGLYAGSTDDAMCDTIELRYEIEPNDYLDHFARWQNLTVEELSYDDEAISKCEDTSYREVPIDAIRTIRIGYDT